MELERNRYNRLVSIQRAMKDRVVGKISKAQPGKPKKFGTFPYPYMNGRLHGGHAYTLTKVDFMMRYYMEKGYNTLFPFGFHGTGMPIVACASKLCDELDKFTPDQYDVLEKDTQIKILMDMGIKTNELQLFRDPKYWIVYFSERAKEDVEEIGISYDPRRSFYTTDMNPSYDSFVRWQFNRLIRDGYIKKGKRYVVYSKKDNQPCADHDRSTGEGVEPIRLSLRYITYNEYNYLITGALPDTIDNLFVDNSAGFIEFTHRGKLYVCSRHAYDNIALQLDDVMFRKIHNMDTLISALIQRNIRVTNVKLPFGTGIAINQIHEPVMGEHEDPSEPFKYYEPNDVVVSRSGDVCVVALTDQWFINYDDPEIKEKLRKYVMTEFECYDEGVRKQFMSAIDWISQWPCSRNFGLGTKLPDTDQIIDSLSDSTIYMAFYTIAHLLHIIPVDMMTDAFWDCIFMDAPIPDELNQNEVYANTIDEMREEFKYWYPLDLRISGKDLVQNHLTMCLFNHMMIWKDISYVPRKFMIGGYLVLNGKKMSKHTGNFMTLTQGVEKFGADAYRFALANNDGIDDGNFEDKQADVAIMKLTTELEWIENFIVSLMSDTDVTDIDIFDIFDRVFIDEMACIMNCADRAYERGMFRTVIQEIHKLIASRLAYINIKRQYKSSVNKMLFKKYISNFVTIVSPICPFICEHIKVLTGEIIEYKTWDTIDYIPSSYKYLRDVVNEVMGELNSSITKMDKKKIDYKNVVVTVISDYTPIERMIVDHVLTYDGVSNWNDFIGSLSISGIHVGQIKRFASFIKTKIATYGKDYVVWSMSGDEFNVVNDSVRKILNNEKIICVCRCPDETTMFNMFPGYPNVKMNIQ